MDEALRASTNATINSYKEMIAMLKEGGMSVGVSTAPAASEEPSPAPAAPAAAPPVEEGAAEPSSPVVGRRRKRLGMDPVE